MYNFEHTYSMYNINIQYSNCLHDISVRVDRITTIENMKTLQLKCGMRNTTTLTRHY